MDSDRSSLEGERSESGYTKQVRFFGVIRCLTVLLRPFNLRSRAFSPVFLYSRGKCRYHYPSTNTQEALFL